MKDLNREQVAFELFKIMNEGRFPDKCFMDCVSGQIIRSGSAKQLVSMWDQYKAEGWHEGYLRIADEIVAKGYKP